MCACAQFQHHAIYFHVLLRICLDSGIENFPKPDISVNYSNTVFEKSWNDAAFCFYFIVVSFF